MISDRKLSSWKELEDARLWDEINEDELDETELERIAEEEFDRKMFFFDTN